jgi:hypothetical protein
MNRKEQLKNEIKELMKEDLIEPASAQDIILLVDAIKEQKQEGKIYGRNELPYIVYGDGIPDTIANEIVLEMLEEVNYFDTKNK